MSEHTAVISWKFSGNDYLKGQYSREHTWRFDGGVSVPASAAPSAVPAPYSNPASVDPEEAFVASLSACHMLWYLHLCSDAGIVVTEYVDRAEGTMAEGAGGVGRFVRVTLKPGIAVKLGADLDQARALHHAAHAKCFIANSVNFPVECAPEFRFED